MEEFPGIYCHGRLPCRDISAYRSFPPEMKYVPGDDIIDKI
jgi:hypothetical protein